MKNTYLFGVITFLLAILLGVSISTTVHWYIQYVELTTKQIIEAQLGAYRRIFSIESIDNNVVQARVIKPTIAQEERFRFYVTEDTGIFQQDPIVEDGIVVGFTPTKSLSIEDLRPGMQAIARILVKEEGMLEASEISVGLPFPRP